MKKINPNLVIILFIIILTLLLFNRNASPPEKKYTLIDSIVYTNIDSVNIIDSIVPIPIEVYDTLWIHNVLPLDTSEIVRDWLTMRVYKGDTIINDTNLVVVVSDTVQFNKKRGGSSVYLWKQPTVIKKYETNVTTIKYKYSLGVLATSRLGSYVTLDIHKGRLSYSVMYGFNSYELKRTIGVGVKINF